MKRTIGLMSAVLVGASVSAAEGPKIGGYVVPKMTYSRLGANDPNTGKKVPSRFNFTVPDVALKATHNIEGYSVLVDIPMASQAGSPSFDIAGATTQAYISGKTDMNITWKFGQFDTPFGIQKNDSPENKFAYSGIIYGQMPKVHKGLSATYGMGDMGLEAIVAVPSTWTGGTGGDTYTDSPDGALNFSLGMGDMSFALGALHGQTQQRSRWGMFANMKVKMDALSASVEYFQSRDNDAIVAGHKKYKMGVGGWFGYDMSDDMSLGLRAQWMSHDQARQYQVTAGPQFKIQDNFQVKTDYTFQNNNGGTFSAGTKHNAAVTTTAQKSVSDHIVALAGVYTF